MPLDANAPAPDQHLALREGESQLRPLRYVQPDDIVHLKTRHGNFRYRVRETLIVNPEDVWVLDSTPATKLTLITWHPFDYIGNALRRFIVRAERVDVAHGLTARVYPEDGRCRRRVR